MVMGISLLRATTTYSHLRQCDLSLLYHPMREGHDRHDFINVKLITLRDLMRIIHSLFTSGSFLGDTETKYLA